MKTTTYTAHAALTAAVTSVGLRGEEYRVVHTSLCDGLYAFTLQTPYQCWEFYVDAATGEVLGCSSEPLTDLEMIYESGEREHLAA